jgi:hypothetical protein
MSHGITDHRKNSIQKKTIIYLVKNIRNGPDHKQEFILHHINITSTLHGVQNL